MGNKDTVVRFGGEGFLEVLAIQHDQGNTIGACMVSQRIDYLEAEAERLSKLVELVCYLIETCMVSQRIEFLEAEAEQSSKQVDHGKQVELR